MAVTHKLQSAALFLAATCLLIGSSLGAVHEVGDSAGWSFMDYDKWASSKNFHVGDTILFNYNSMAHDVNQVTLQDFQSCNADSPIATFTTGSDSVTLKNPGHYYFLCSFPGHCGAGQKVDIMVTPVSLHPSASPRSAPPYRASSPSPAPSRLPSPSSSSQTLPDSDVHQSNDASPLQVFSFALINLAIFVVGFSF